MTTKRNLGLLVLLIAALVGTSGVAIAQDSTDTWRDSVDADDIRYLGTVTKVWDDKFEIRTLDDGAMTFTIPADADYSTAVFTGNEVQVWTDGGTVSYVATFGETVDTADSSNDDMMDRDRNDDMNNSMNDDMDVDADADGSMSDDRASASASMSADMDDDAANEASASASVAVDTRGDDMDVDADADANTNSWDDADDEDRWDGNTLPQTGSLTPAIAGFGLLLILVGAALRIRA